MRVVFWPLGDGWKLPACSGGWDMNPGHPEHCTHTGHSVIAFPRASYNKYTLQRWKAQTLNEYVTSWYFGLGSPFEGNSIRLKSTGTASTAPLGQHHHDCARLPVRWPTWSSQSCSCWVTIKTSLHTSAPFSEVTKKEKVTSSTCIISYFSSQGLNVKAFCFYI